MSDVEAINLDTTHIMVAIPKTFDDDMQYQLARIRQESNTVTMMLHDLQAKRVSIGSTEAILHQAIQHLGKINRCIDHVKSLIEMHDAAGLLAESEQEVEE